LAEERDPKELSPEQRVLAQRLSDNPLDLFQGKTVGWLEDFIRITVGDGSRSGSGSSGVSAAYYVPGDVKVTLADLTAQTSEYVFEDDSGRWLYCNGVAVSQTTYADLYAAIGPNAYGTDSGGNFFLPDPRGRALFFTGTNADADLGDNDGTALADRGAKHIHTAEVTGAPGGTFASSTHTHDITTSPELVEVGAVNVADHAVYTSSAPSATASPTLGTLDASVGSGGSTDAPSHLFIGSLLVRF
jgi:microcystin-dependent protein